jgi:adenine-specific DNA methylase
MRHTNIIYIASQCALNVQVFLADLFTLLQGKTFFTAMELNCAQAQALCKQYNWGTVKNFCLTAQSLLIFLKESESIYKIKVTQNAKKEQRYKLCLK